MTTTTTTPAVATAPATSKFMTLDDVRVLLSVIQLPYTIQSGFMKIGFPGCRIYVAATKTVRRVDLSGFEVPAHLGKVPHCGVFGKVKQQLVLGDSPEEALSNLTDAIEIAMTIAAPAPKEKKVKLPKTNAEVLDPTPQANVPSSTEDLTTLRKDRLKEIARLKDVASSMQSEVSPAIIEEEASLITVLNADFE